MVENSLTRKGIFVIGKESLAKNNWVYYVEFKGVRAVCKIYMNKYFLEQQNYEKRVLNDLKPLGFKLPELLAEGEINGNKYSILSEVDGRNLLNGVPCEYEWDVANFLEKLHQVNIPLPTHPLQKDLEVVVEKALNRMGIDSIKRKYNELVFYTGNVGFCHRDPNFKHIFFNKNGLSGVVDFEDSMMLPIETDYVSFIKDQIETRRPTKEILNFIKHYSGDKNNLCPYLIRLYVLDLGFGHGVEFRSKQAIIESLDLLFLDTDFEEKINRIKNDNS